MRFCNRSIFCPLPEKKKMRFDLPTAPSSRLCSSGRALCLALEFFRISAIWLRSSQHKVVREIPRGHFSPGRKKKKKNLLTDETCPLALVNERKRERDTYRYTFTADALHDARESYLNRALFIGRQSISARRLCAVEVKGITRRRDLQI